ncbi:MAG TPA: outer membrane beta-barrel protein [Gammaproteobacteria bacterium]|nr:outer membrane beta-barrel protein [Gammaproteobacteria bacterium]
MRYIQIGALALFCLFNVGPCVAEEAKAAAEPVEQEPARDAALPVDTGPAYDEPWSGFYAGISIGSRTLKADWTTTEVRDPDGFEADPLSDPQASLEDSKVEPGLYLGYSWNPGNWVFGLEIISQYYKNSASIDDRIPGLGDPDSNPRSYVVVNTENSDSFDPRVRAGFLPIPQLLLFSTLSRTGLDVEVTAVCPEDGNVCNPFLETPVSHRAATTLDATVIGLGAEYKLDRLQLRLEYLYADYGSFDFTAMQENTLLSFGADAQMDLTTRTLVLGLSYGL